MILSDSHIHTFFSTDSEENPENIINTAIQKGFKSICFTDHNDFDFPYEEDGTVPFQLNYDEYIKYMQELKQKYSDKITIHIGVEQGIIPSAYEKIESFDPLNELDFIIGSSHLLYNKDPYFPDFWDGRDIKNTLIDYYENIANNIKNCNNYDIYGHLDYIIRYIPDKSFSYNWKDYYDYFETILKMLIEKGKGIEINSAGLKYGLPEPNPCFDVIKMYKDFGGEILTIGSDAHKAEHFAYHFDKIAGIIENAGFGYYCVFNNRKPDFIKL